MSIRVKATSTPTGCWGKDCSRTLRKAVVKTRTFTFEGEVRLRCKLTGRVPSAGLG